MNSGYWDEPTRPQYIVSMFCMDMSTLCMDISALVQYSFSDYWGKTCTYYWATCISACIYSSDNVSSGLCRMMGFW